MDLLTRSGSCSENSGRCVTNTEGDGRFIVAGNSHGLRFGPMERISTSNYGSVGWRSEYPQVCRLFDDGDVRTNTGEFPNPTDGDLGGELQG